MRKQQQLVVGLAMVAAISGVAAFPLLNPTKRVKAEAEPEVTADEPEQVAEAKPAPAPAKNAAPQRRKVTRWSGGGDVVVGSASPSTPSPSSRPGGGGTGRLLNAPGGSGRGGGGLVRVQWRETEVRKNGDGTATVHSTVKEKTMSRAEADKFIADMKGQNETNARNGR